MNDQPRITDDEFYEIRKFLFPGQRLRSLKASAKNNGHVNAAGRTGIEMTFRAGSDRVPQPVEVAPDLGASI